MSSLGVSGPTCAVVNPRGLSVLDGRRLAIIVSLGSGREVVLKGVAHYEEDPQLGRILRTEPDEAQLGDPAIIFVERETQLTFQRDKQHDCDYSVCLSAQ